MAIKIKNPFTGKTQDITPRIDSKTLENVIRNTTGIVTGGASQILEKGYDKLVDDPQKAAHEQRQVQGQRQEDAYKEFEGLISPDFDMSDFQTADLVKADVTEQGITEFDKVSTDPGLMQAKMNALRKLEEIGSSNGLLDADKALLAKTQRDAAMQDRGRREAILQNAAARGMSGTGNALLAQLDSSQAAAERSSQAGLDIAGMAQQRALDSINRAGTLAGQIQSQDFDQQARRAQAQDAINQFNSGQKNSMSQYNTGQSNSMNQFNTNVKNQSQQHKNNMTQQQFENQHGIAKDKANVRMGMATTAGTRANQHSATAGNNIETLLDIAMKGGKAVTGAM